jgi:hypothetical protein
LDTLGNRFAGFDLFGKIFTNVLYNVKSLTIKTTWRKFKSIWRKFTPSAFIEIHIRDEFRAMKIKMLFAGLPTPAMDGRSASPFEALTPDKFGIERARIVFELAAAAKNRLTQKRRGRERVGAKEDKGKMFMNNKSFGLNLIGWLFGITVLAIGLLNLFLVHPVPAVVYLLLSFVYLPPADAVLRKNFGFSIPRVVKIILGIFIIMFTLGVSDLGDMIDKL